MGDAPAPQIAMLSKEPASHPAPATGRPHATFVGVLPGPRNGMTLLTQAVVSELRQHFDLREFDIAAGDHSPGIRWRLLKFRRSLLAPAWLLMVRRRSASEFVYLVANSQGGLFYNLAQVIVARLRGYHVVLHHHVYSYITARDWRMTLLLRLCGPRSRHVVACPQMADDLDATYGENRRYAFVAPSVVSARQQNVSPTARSSAQPFVLGHLSNLNREKGLGEVIETLRLLTARGVPVHCLIAGPAASSESRRMIENASAEFAEKFQWLGPVYDRAKAEFFARIHAFVFPTRYRNESWGMVLDEALAAGVPVITYAAGCTPHLVHGANGAEESPRGGMVLSQDESLPNLAATQIEQWIANPDDYAEAARQAQLRGQALAAEGRQGMHEFIGALLREGGDA